MQRLSFLGSGITVRHDSVYDGDDQFILGCQLNDLSQSPVKWFRAETTTQLQENSKYSIDNQQGTLTISNAGKYFFFLKR